MGRREEERFVRQNSSGYSGWASAFTIAVIAKVAVQAFRKSSGSLAMFAADSCK